MGFTLHAILPASLKIVWLSEHSFKLFCGWISRNLVRLIFNLVSYGTMAIAWIDICGQYTLLVLVVITHADFVDRRG